MSEANGMDFEALLEIVDHLSPQELARLHKHIEARRSHTIRWGIVPPENLAKLEEITRPLQEDAAKMTEEEINTLIDEAIAEVRRERKAKSRD